MAALYILRVRASWIVTVTGLVPSEDIYTSCVNGKMASVGGGGGGGGGGRTKLL